jgi:hypothetical protein
MIYPFVSEPAEQSQVENSYVGRLLKALEREEGNVNKLSDEEKDLIESVFSELGHPDTYTKGFIKISGYIIDFNKFLKTYWIKDKYYGIREVRSFSKMYVRKCSCTPHNILKIVEVD